MLDTVAFLSSMDDTRHDLYMEMVRKLSKAGLPQPIGEVKGKPQAEGIDDTFLVWGDALNISYTSMKGYDHA